MKDTQQDFCDRLLNDFPQLFPKDGSGKAVEPECGIYVPPGWELIVYQLCKAIHRYTTSTYRYNSTTKEKEYPRFVTINQIKEKYGELRFYINGGDGRVEGMIGLAECMAETTCEATGQPGVLCSSKGGLGGWYKTLSEEARKMECYSSYKPCANTLYNIKEENQ